MKKQIRQLEYKDIERVLTIHKNALPNDLFPNLGLRVLRQYYRRAVEDGNQYLIGCTIDKELVGFCLVEQSPTIKHNIVFFVILFFRALLLLFIHPKLLISGIIQTLKQLKPREGYAEITFIAVSPDNQGLGIGTELVNNALTSHNKLLTKTSNNRLKDFYIRRYCGEIVKTFSVFDKTYFYMILKLTNNSE